MPKVDFNPNVTFIPHLIIRDWMPKLRDTELRVLLVVADQTLGWVEDPKTGRRKTEDWISHSQLIEKTGRNSKAISNALRTLIAKHRLVEARDRNGNVLETSAQRRRIGRIIFYRLNLHPVMPTLFD